MSILAVLAMGPALAQGVDSGAIRLGAPSNAPDEADTEPPPVSPFQTARRGFDFAAFDSRLESLWFQRKAFLAEGRDEDAARQADLIRAFCEEEGVTRVENMAGALLVEARRFRDEGHYSKALTSLDLAQYLDPGRAQIHFARAQIHWKSGGGLFRAVRELATGAVRAMGGAWVDLTGATQVAVILVVALLGAVAIFALLMFARYQVPLRHEVEEWAAVRGASPTLATVAGWALLFLPFLTWFGAGWAALFWLVLFFRFMWPSERATAIALLTATLLAGPAYRFAVAVYGVSADPVVRTTLASADGNYDPSKIHELQELIAATPENPVYHFLLGDLYRSGRYYEEAFDEYQRVLQLDPSIYQAQINIGNIYYHMGQYDDAIAHYQKAIDAKPTSALAYYDMHLAQSEAFHFKDAEISLIKAREIDAGVISDIMSRSSGDDGSPGVVEARIELGSVWQAALSGDTIRDRLDFGSTGSGATRLLGFLLNPLSLASAVGLALCGVFSASRRLRPTARRCIRCSRPFCQRCKSGRESKEYCSQCYHLFVLGDGLAPETKTRKMYEVERHERRTRRIRRWLSLVLPGAGQVLRGQASKGCLLILAWVAVLIALQPQWLAPLERLVGFEFRLDALRPAAIPAVADFNPIVGYAVVGALIVWTAGNVWRLRRRGL